MNRTPFIKINPFLLPTCPVCDGPVSLSRIEPASDGEPEQRIYCCPECGAEKTIGGRASKQDP